MRVLSFHVTLSGLFKVNSNLQRTTRLQLELERFKFKLTLLVLGAARGPLLPPSVLRSALSGISAVFDLGAHGVKNVKLTCVLHSSRKCHMLGHVRSMAPGMHWQFSHGSSVALTGSAVPYSTMLCPAVPIHVVLCCAVLRRRDRAMPTVLLFLAAQCSAMVCTCCSQGPVEQRPGHRHAVLCCSVLFRAVPCCSVPSSPHAEPRQSASRGPRRHCEGTVGLSRPLNSRK